MVSVVDSDGAAGRLTMNTDVSARLEPRDELLQAFGSHVFPLASGRLVVGVKEVGRLISLLARGFGLLGVHAATQLTDVEDLREGRLASQTREWACEGEEPTLTCGREG